MSIKPESKFKTKLTFITSIFSIMILSFSYSSTVNAALSATTAQVINGTAPYLTFNGGTTKATTTEELLGITLSNNTTYIKRKSGEVGFDASNPIELPVAGQKLSDIKTLIPTNNTSVNLSTLLTSNNWGDDDGDGNITLTTDGTLSISAVDANNNVVSLSDTLSACNAPYKVTLTSTAGKFETQYGVPREAKFDGSTADYYIKPKIGNPYACFAQPNLDYGTGVYAGPTSQWDTAKGFKLQNLGNPSSNFPTTGSKGLYFNLTIAGALGGDVTYKKEPSTSGLDLTITGSGNVAKVVLTGPGNGSTQVQAATAVPTTFTLYSDVSQQNVIYSFKISQWFIARPGGVNNTTAKNFCTALGYNQPLRSDYTNAPNVTQPAYDPITGTHSGDATFPNNTYTRTIGGGLFAEWGYTYSGYYTSSDWESYYYWASEAFSGSNQYAVYSYNGDVGYSSPSASLSRAACVRP